MMRRFIQALIALSLFALAPAGAQQFFARQAGPTCSSTLGTVKSFSGITEISMPSSDVLLCSAPVTVEATIAGGGAGGGNGCGGGAGQVLHFPTLAVTVQMPVLVGLGGAGSTGGVASSPGSTSWIGLTYATGGAQTGVTNGDGPTTASGSGSGACAASIATHPGGTGGGQTNENAGGAVNSTGSPFGGGGGGGAGAVGGSVSLAGKSGAGGIGMLDVISGNWLGGGGGGSCNAAGGAGCAPATGGRGGGGAGFAGNGVAGTVNTGGGGGGGFNANTGGRGGDGVVTVRYTGAGCVSCILPSGPVITLPITANLAAFYSVIKLSGWAGACLQVTRASDSTTLDIGFINNVCDWTAADTFGANTTITVSKLYDQSGAGLNLTCTSSGIVGPPTFSGLNTWFKIRPVSFEGIGNTAFQWCQNTTFAVNTNAMTVYQVTGPRTSWDTNGFWQFSNAAFSTVYTTLQNNNTSIVANYPTANTFTTGLFAIGAPGIISTSFSGSVGSIVRVNGTQVTNAANAASNVAAGFKLGTTGEGGMFDLFSIAVYGAAHTSAQMISIESGISAPYSLQSSFTNLLIYGGSSLITGYDSTMNQTPGWQLGFGKSANGPLPTWKPLIMGSAGRLMAAECQNQITTYNGLFDPTKTFNVVALDAPSNDISVQTFISQAQAEAYADTFYTGTTIPCVSALLGAHPWSVIVVPTIIARGIFTTANFAEYARLKYNADVVAGAVANGYVTADRAGAPFGIFNSPAASADPTYYFTTTGVGGTHLTNLGYNIMGAIDKAAVCSAGGC